MVNATSCIFWALSLNSSLPYILGMCVGILIFILLYIAVDDYLLKNHPPYTHQALVTAIYIKAGLQLIIIPTMLFPISIETLIGAVSLDVAESFMGSYVINIANPSALSLFLFALIATLFTGLLMSMLVWIISFITMVVQSYRLSKDQ